MENPTVLFVDDEVRLLQSLRRGLMDEPYLCLFANSGAEALEILKKNKVHVIVTDMRMPEMNGLELLRKVRELYPDIVRMVLSGYTQITTLLTAINEGHIYKFITKPWKLEEEFKPMVREALKYYDTKNPPRESVPAGASSHSSS
ncbi:MAG: response regulator [Anaerohalosphaeraceae bacterium]